MAKPRSAARARAKGYKPRRREVDELTTRELEAVASHNWFALMCLSGKERVVEQALRLLGFKASFAPMDVRYRRVSHRTSKARTQTHEQFTRATLPGYVFVGVPIRDGSPKEAQGLPWGLLAQAKENRSPCGMVHIHGFIASGAARRPALISPWSIRDFMADSMVPLFLDDDEEEAFDFDYGAATAENFLSYGDVIEVVRGPLRGQRFPFKSADGVYLVCEAPFGDLKIPAASAVSAA